MTHQPPYLRAQVLRSRALYESGCEAVRLADSDPIGIHGYPKGETASFWLGCYCAMRFRLTIAGGGRRGHGQKRGLDTPRARD